MVMTVRVVCLLQTIESLLTRPGYPMSVRQCLTGASEHLNVQSTVELEPGRKIEESSTVVTYLYTFVGSNRVVVLTST